jgi:hypothetical protein
LHKRKEVDFVLVKDTKVVAIEVKSNHEKTLPVCILSKRNSILIDLFWWAKKAFLLRLS